VTGHTPSAEAWASAYRGARRPDEKAGALVGLAGHLKEQGHLGEAAAILTQAVTLVPSLASAHLELGRTYEQAGLPDEALAAYRRALAAEPENDAARRACASLGDGAASEPPGPAGENEPEGRSEAGAGERDEADVGERGGTGDRVPIVPAAPGGPDAEREPTMDDGPAEAIEAVTAAAVAAPAVPPAPAAATASDAAGAPTGARIALGDDGGDGIPTATLAELYREQGFLRKAIDTYERMLRMADDEKLRLRVEELREEIRALRQGARETA
jgi:tetratricopeptide (TPR) repeat protein